MFQMRDHESQQELIPKSMKDYCETNNIAFKKYMQFIRIALTGVKDGPPVAEIITLLGVETSCKRLQNNKLYEAK
ncbi:hypothetical protein B4U80_14258 [Leptotrombidium deliense]|uniref:Aminoacyl-tRNA synthetase class I anticodon-binding domain-containing protein n=1 Tax=Leptotrombidium deliense TaxID=299467 RepID=A0A443RZ61_9ACAR|nr:hypothetical protein B4U80_14258 [Leptotrombidium deliense]